MAQSSGCFHKALGTGKGAVAEGGLHPTYHTETLAWPGMLMKKDIVLVNTTPMAWLFSLVMGATKVHYLLMFHYQQTDSTLSVRCENL